MAISQAAREARSRLRLGGCRCGRCCRWRCRCCRGRGYCCRGRRHCCRSGGRKHGRGRARRGGRGGFSNHWQSGPVCYGFFPTSDAGFGGRFDGTNLFGRRGSRCRHGSFLGWIKRFDHVNSPLNAETIISIGRHSAQASNILKHYADAALIQVNRSGDSGSLIPGKDRLPRGHRVALAAALRRRLDSAAVCIRQWRDCSPAAKRHAPSTRELVSATVGCAGGCRAAF